MTLLAVREALLRHDYTVDGVLGTVGAEAMAALGRGERVPARHALADEPDTPLTTLIRLFLLGEPVPRALAEEALELASAAELVDPTEVDGRERIRPLVSVHPYPLQGQDGYIVSDFPIAALAAAGERPGADHVVGVGGASVTLATITPRDPVDRVLDLGTGCGIQAALAAQHAARVTATDRNPRALRLARLTAALSGVEFDLREGSLFEPVEQETFDLVVANPPFVISPHSRFTYRESALRADDLSATVIAGAAAHLGPGGTAVVLANWLHTDQPWHDRLAGWAPRGCGVWAAQREYLTAAEYVELWLRDSADTAGRDYERLYAEWLTYFDDLGATGVGFGWVVVRNGGREWFVAEDVADAQRLPTGDEVVEQLAAFDRLHEAGAVQVLAGRPRWADGVELHASTDPVRGGSLSELAVTRGWRPVEDIDPFLAELLSGTGTLAERIDAVGGDRDADELTAGALAGVRRLIGAGMVVLDPA